MGVTPEEVASIAKLARLGLQDDEVEKFAGQLSGILDHFVSLSSIETEGAEPTAHTLPLSNVMREDGVMPSLPRGEALANAPEEESGHFRVKAVLE